MEFRMQTGLGMAGPLQEAFMYMEELMGSCKCSNGEGVTCNSLKELRWSEALNQPRNDCKDGAVLSEMGSADGYYIDSWLSYGWLCYGARF